MLLTIVGFSDRILKNIEEIYICIIFLKEVIIMKKMISVMLVVIMLFSLSAPAMAAEYVTWGGDIPVVMIYGDGQPIYDTEGNKVFHFKEMLNMIGDSADGGLGEAAINILMPFLLEGIVEDKWDNYYAALEKEIGELFTDARYNEDGENWNGSGLGKEALDLMEYNLSYNKGLRGFYDAYDFEFFYDWRQDPRDTADEFNQYIKDIKELTGAPKVSIIARCLGTSVVMAYLEEYGLDDVHGVSFNGSVAAGGEIISESISGKFVIDVNAINRMISDFETIGWFEVDSFITSSIDMAAKILMVSGFEFNETEIYAKLVQGVTSALALSTFFTWPGYWALVSDKDYEDALYYVFGEEGSEKRVKYAKLIDKINGYHYDVMNHIDDIFQEIRDKDVKTAVIAKYGFQLAPIAESRDLVADQFASVKLASFGATTSTIYEPLSEEYIAERVAQGKGKYISPDKRIDASTCAFPDSTWFTKGITHSDWTAFETSVLFKVVTADRQLTIDDFDYTQFIVYDNEKAEAFPMTEENYKTESWEANKNMDNPEDKYGKIFSVVTTLILWLIDLINFLREKFGN